MSSCLFIFALTLWNTAGSSPVDLSYRVDCAPRPGDSKHDCVQRGCVWDDAHYPTVPPCYFPTNTGYTVKSESAGHLELEKSSQGGRNPYGEDFPELDLTYQQIGSALKVSIGKGNRYIPPVPLDETTPIKSAEKLALNYNNDNIFSFTVTRAGADNTTKIWDTSIGGLLFADQYIQIATYLPTDRIYGFGENIHQELKHNFSNYTTWGMFARDDSPNSKDPTYHNYYGVHPFYMGVEADGRAHGVLIFNSNAQEVSTGPAPHLIYRTIGGQLDVFFLPGPQPEQVLQQYHQLIGHPNLPAYWSLGFQLCRWGYESTQDLKQTVQRQIDAGIPIDVAYADIDYMDRYKDFTLGSNWADLPQYIKQLHQKGMHVILIFDPAIEVDYATMQRALEMDASFIKWPRTDLVPKDVQSLYPMVQNTSIMLGIVWPHAHAAFPDFLDPSGVTNQWWADEFALYHKNVPFDGIWIDMNEPSNFGTNEDDPFSQFITDHPNIQPLVCPVTGSDAHLDVPPYLTSSVYKREENALCAKSLCMLAKTGGGRLDFYDTRSLYGWSQSVATAKAMKQATGKRGTVISSLHFHASMFGGSVIRPVFFEFPLDSQSHSLSHQFMWGAGVMVVPVLSPGVDTVTGYLPGQARWYSLSNAHQYGSLQPSGYSSFSAPRDTPLPCFVRAGSIIPKQRPGMTTTASRANEFQLLIALSQDVSPKAQGELYWDDGESYVDDINTYKDYIHLEYDMQVDTRGAALTINCSFGCETSPNFEIPTLDTIEVFGHSFEPDLGSLKLNGKDLKVDAEKCSYEKEKQILVIDTPQLIHLNKDGPVWTISWSKKENGESDVGRSSRTVGQ